MIRDELIQIIIEVQKHKSEFDELETRTARGASRLSLILSCSDFLSFSSSSVWDASKSDSLSQGL